MLMKGLSMLEIDLKRVLADKMSKETRCKYLNTLKILVYLVVEFSNYCEKKQLAAKDNDLMPTAGTKTAAKKPAAKKAATAKK